MSIRERVQEDMKTAMKTKDKPRLDCLRMVKAALLNKEKEKGQPVTDEEALAVLRSEVRKRRESAEVYREHGQDQRATEADAEVDVIESFLPEQLSPEQVEEKVRAYLAEHPDLNHAGKLTGALMKELGGQVDGKTLNQMCQKVLEEQQ